jgi:ketosteroid isomerase-like protein
MSAKDTKSESEIRSLIEDWKKALRSKDTDAMYNY